MRTPQICSFILITAAALAGCGGGGEGDGGDDDGTNTDGGGDVDAPIPADYTELVGRDWSLPAGQPDTYKCVRLTIPNDTYVTNIMSQAPTGSHHAVLSISSSRTAGADGEYDCSVGELGTVMLYASGVGTSPLDFPDGVGIKIPAGTQIHLNLHLYNASDAPLSGHSGILVKQQSTPPPTLAEMVFAGTLVFSIPSNGQTTNASGGCTADHDYTLFSVWPHQHQIGTHHRFEIIRSGVQDPFVLHDASFAFGEQKYYEQTPAFEVHSGDQIRTTCSWVNNTGSTITFGDSSNKEMCFTGLYSYPAVGGDIFSCVTGGGFFP